LEEVGAVVKVLLLTVGKDIVGFVLL